MKFLGCLVLLASTLAYGQGYDSACYYDSYGVMHCHTRPYEDDSTTATRLLQEMDREQHRKQQLRMQQQQLELQRQQLELMRQQYQRGQEPQQQLQSGILKTTSNDRGQLLCYYVPSNGKKFIVNGAAQDGMWYPAQAGRCGQQLRMANDGRGWIQ